MSVPHKNQRFILFWVIAVIVVAMAMIGVVTTTNERRDTAAQEAHVRDTVATSIARYKATPSPPLP